MMPRLDKVRTLVGREALRLLKNPSALMVLGLLVAFSLLQGRTQALADDINAAVASTVNLVMRNKDKLNVAAVEEPG